MHKCVVVLALVFSLAFAATASAKPIFMSTLQKELSAQRAASGITPPAPPCPQYSLGLSCTPVPETPATSLPYPGNMAYYGGHVQVTPKIYLVYWGWGSSSAWPAGTSCQTTNLSYAGGTITGTLPCDPDGAGKYMADFVDQMGGTNWAGVQSQYFQTDSSGNQQFIQNPTEQLGGIWVDDTNPNTLPKTSLSDSGASGTNTETVLAKEAQLAIQHFGITDLANAQIAILQPRGLSDPNALAQGYCAFHDMTYPGVADGIFNGITQGIAFDNIPYQLAINQSGVNVCGENVVNSDARGKLDGFSVVFGHEIEEAVTDPGAEWVVGSSPTYLGGWYDTIDANENGDKCAWVGENLFTGTAPPEPIPGAMGNIQGNKGDRFAVQSLWSNASAGGLGYCAGAGTDLPTDSATAAPTLTKTQARKATQAKNAKAKRSRHRSAKRRRA